MKAEILGLLRVIGTFFGKFGDLFKPKRKFKPDLRQYHLNNNVRRKTGNTQKENVFKMKANKRHKHNKMVRKQKQEARRAA